MAIGSIVLNYHDLPNCDICDDLEQYELVIAELGSRVRTRIRVREIEDQLNKRLSDSGRSTATVSHLTIAVEKGEYDFDVIWWQPGIVDIDEVERAVRKVVMEWRSKGQPNRKTAIFEYVKFRGNE